MAEGVTRDHKRGLGPTVARKRDGGLVEVRGTDEHRVMPSLRGEVVACPGMNGAVPQLLRYNNVIWKAAC